MKGQITNHTLTISKLGMILSCLLPCSILSFSVHSSSITPHRQLYGMNNMAKRDSFHYMVPNDKDSSIQMTQSYTSSSHIQKQEQLSRRNAFSQLVSNTILCFGIVGGGGSVASAADSAGDTIFLTGKAPKVPGKKPKDKSDVSGTRKDPKFLRSVADCKSKCELTPTSDGLSKSREDCLSECQDICCTTYEQCTFAIVPRF